MEMNTQGNYTNALSREAIVRELFETYESLYDIDVDTSTYQCYHESDSYSALELESSGMDFFKAIVANIPKTIYHEDREYVLHMLQKNNMLKVLKKEKYYTVVYRLMLDGKPVYHKIRATMETLNGRPHILLGVRNVEETVREEKKHEATVASLHQKEKNHLEAILASAWGYLEANLTKDILLECSPDFMERCRLSFARKKPTRYSDLQKQFCMQMAAENSNRYLAISDRNYLIRSFRRGEKRASVSFVAPTAQEAAKPFKTVFYLYRDDASGDILAFCVIYDLTEQQRKEKELQELERELRMSRIRNSTSQMQPHFLYNALGSIQEVMLENPQYASDLLGDFTLHLRSCIRAMASDAPIPFTQELENIRAYVNIEKMRFGKKLKVEYETEALDFKILPLSIQPLVENAIRHGIYERGAAGGTVIIRSLETVEEWIIEVEDDGVGFDFAAFQRSEKHDATGINNITFRLDKVMHAGVTIHSTPGVGTKVTVVIPKKANTA